MLLIEIHEEKSEIKRKIRPRFSLSRSVLKHPKIYSTFSAKILDIIRKV